LDAGWPSLYLISDNLKTALENNNFTGWKIFDARVFDLKDNEIPGYYGFSITGGCGPVSYDKSEIIEKRLVSNGPLIKYYQGMQLGLGKWDNSDFFLPEKYFGIMISQRVADVLRKSKLTNIRLENILTIETKVRV